MEIYRKIRVVIADDHDIYRDGLKELLNKQPEVEIVGEASNGQRLVELAKKLAPDVILTDLKMPLMDGVQVIKTLASSGAVARCIVLSTFESDYLVVEALQAGAMGIL